MWNARCGYLVGYAIPGAAYQAATGGTETRYTASQPSAMAVPFPVQTLTRSQSLNVLTGFEKRADVAGEKLAVASAQTKQAMYVSGKTIVSPVLASMFPLILLAGLFVLIILKK